MILQILKKVKGEPFEEKRLECSHENILRYYEILEKKIKDVLKV